MSKNRKELSSAGKKEHANPKIDPFQEKEVQIVSAIYEESDFGCSVSFSHFSIFHLATSKYCLVHSCGSLGLSVSKCY